MKYIRTKDGRTGEFYQDQSFTITCSLGCIDKKEILKQADTIEELCDAIVCGIKLFYPLPIETKEYFDGKKRIIYPLTTEKFNWEEIKDYCDRCNIQYIYGAIWTDKGLIYKAKMKDILPNGEIDWELL